MQPGFLPCWPEKGQACVLRVADFVSEELREDLKDPSRCLLPRAAWPVAPPRSRVHATDAEWYSLVKAGASLGIFGKASESELFRDQFGNPVLNGAMGVDKPKEVNGKTEVFLRFMCIFVPINAYLRRLRGDSSLLPYLNQLSLVVLEEGEVLTIDSEDMQSCFNLFCMPPAWAGYFAFEKQVPASAFGGSPNELVYAYIRSVPMGWFGAVDVMQCMARRFVLGRCGVAAAAELKKDQEVPDGDIAIVCMDGFGFIRRLEAVRVGANSPGPSAEHDRFVKACADIGLPLNAGKRLVRGLSAQILGGELDGVLGTLSLERSKGLRLHAKSLALLCGGCWTKAALQHWAGHFCFAATFGRPVFSVMQEIFVAIADDSQAASTSWHCPEAVRLVPFCFTDLRASIRRVVSASDASETGGGASEVKQFSAALDPEVQEAFEDRIANGVEESAGSISQAGRTCGTCRMPLEVGRSRAPCPGCCGGAFCSEVCLTSHLRAAGDCQRVAALGPMVGLSGLCFSRELRWILAHRGVQVREFRGGIVGGCSVVALAPTGPTFFKEGMRSEAHPSGNPWCPLRSRTSAKRDNRECEFAVEAVSTAAEAGGVGLLLHPETSWAWSLPAVARASEHKKLSFSTMCLSCLGGGIRAGRLGILHNSQEVARAVGGCSSWCACAQAGLAAWCLPPSA